MHVAQEIVGAYVRQHWGFVLLGTLFVFFIPFREIVQPHLQGRVVEALQAPGAHGLTQATVAALAAALFIMVGTMLRDRLDEAFVPRLQAFVKTELMDRLFRKHSEDFSHLSTGELVYVLSVIPEITCLWPGPPVWTHRQADRCAGTATSATTSCPTS